MEKKNVIAHLQEEKIIEVKNLTKVFNKEIRAVDNISFFVKRGEIFGFLGPNGAGKTTTIRMLSTLLKPTKGTARIAGHDILNDPNNVRKSIGIVFQEPALDERLTGRENLDFHSRLYGLEKRQREERIKEVLNLVNLKEKADILVKNYSGGMKRRLEIARGLMHFPKVLFLDEPTLGLDTQTRRAIWDYIKKLNKKEGITVFLTTHYMEEADYLCDRVAIMDQGKLLVIGTPEELKNLVQNDVIIVKCSNPKKLEKVIKKEKWSKRMKVHNSFLKVYVERGERKVAKLVNIARKLKIEIETINLRKPTLEDVYLHYTGKTIREEEASPKDMLRKRMRMRR